MLASGVYEVSVYYRDPDAGGSAPLSPTPTIDYSYTSPGKQYGTPTDVAWTADNDFGWTLPAGTDENTGLFVSFGMKQDNGEIREIGMRAGSVGKGTAPFLERFNERVNRNGEGDYCFRVRILSNDLTQSWHSAWSDWSATRHIVSEGDLKTEIEKINTADKAAAVDAVRGLDANSLASSMAADNTGEGVTASLAGLEAALGLTASVVKAPDAADVRLDPAKVTVVGAGFNSRDKATAPTLTISKPAAELQLPVEGYVNANAIQVDLSLGDKVEKNEDGSLLVPVRITLPVPEGMDPQRLRILHFGGDGKYDREIRPYVFDDNGVWTASFVVTHLSPFAFIETAPDSSEPPEPSGTFTVTFDVNGGKALETDTAGTDAEGRLTVLPVPTRSSYKFAGWYTEASGGEKITADTVFDADATIYAHWTKKSSGGSGNSVPVKPVTPVEPETPTAPVEPEAPVVDASEKFSDIAKDAWYAEAVSYVVSRGLMNGTGSGVFQPDAQLSRAMLAQILYNYSGRPAVGSGNAFTDVDGGWYADAVAWAAASGVVQGNTDGSFAPDSAVTREQAAVIFYRFAQTMGFDTGAKGDLNTFTDSGDVSAYARDAMVWASGCGLISGSDGLLSPAGVATRAQVAAMLQRFCEYAAR